MKKILLILPLLIFGFVTWACPACEKQQPKFLKGVAHGGGPTSDWDYVIVIGTIILVAITLYFSVKYIVRPGEANADHIKRTILKFD